MLSCGEFTLPYCINKILRSSGWPHAVLHEQENAKVKGKGGMTTTKFNSFAMLDKMWS